ncbi:flagellar type III secretion system pore protein FliP [Metapseudomonas otitidis]|uniref:flagellar type III secretion system pore protein FliP n=1 Tax=Metapseudomonas otitidis TaxID=319939 RepID=UPI0013F624A6|nr:flagellar type III secretion system pore protein FliP [Pseudomonas otitidis]
MNGGLRMLIASLAMSPGLAGAAGGELTLFHLEDTASGQDFSVKLQVLILMSLLGLLPAMLMLMTCFTRFIIVLSILRQAMGLQQSPPNNVLVGIALVLTLLVMRPVWQALHNEVYLPFEEDRMTLQEGLGKGRDILGRFMLAQTHHTSLEAIAGLAGETLPERREDVDFMLLLPAFVLSELKTAFQLGFMLFVPFLVIDLVVASVLMAMGMMMLSPMMVSLPFKLMVFVLVDGWALTVGTLAGSVQPY